MPGMRVGTPESRSRSAAFEHAGERYVWPRRLCGAHHSLKTAQEREKRLLKG